MSAQPNKLTQLFATHRRCTNTASQHQHQRKGGQERGRHILEYCTSESFMLLCQCVRIKQEAETRRSGIGPSILGKMMLTYLYPRYARRGCFLLATTATIPDMSSQQGSNTYGSSNYGGNPPQSFGGPGRQEMSYLCAGERAVIDSEICSLTMFISHLLYLQIVALRTRSGPVSPFVAGSAAIVSCTKRGPPGVRLSRDSRLPFH